MTIKEMCEEAYKFHCELCRNEGYVPLPYVQFEREYYASRNETRRKRK